MTARQVVRLAPCARVILRGGVLEPTTTPDQEINTHIPACASAGLRSRNVARTDVQLLAWDLFQPPNHATDPLVYTWYLRAGFARHQGAINTTLKRNSNNKYILILSLYRRRLSLRESLILLAESRICVAVEYC